MSTFFNLLLEVGWLVSQQDYITNYNYKYHPMDFHGSWSTIDTIHFMSVMD